VIQRAVNHVRSADKQEVSIGDILASIFEEKDSHAAYFLGAEGITRFEILNYISHGESEAFGEDEADEASMRARGKKNPSEASPLKLYTVELVDRAARGKIDPLIGREPELQRAIQVLCRRRKNNPVFVGEPGVGKTALAEGLAQKIHEKTVPEILQKARIYALDLGALLAGTKFRGDFEKRLKNVIKALKKKEDAILFVDEIHTIIGAGATSGGSMDASNILKPTLASGELKCIGSTTYEEFKNHFEKDRAFARRFEKIEVHEPTVDETVEILKGLKACYEEHHQMIYTEDALHAAAELSAKYINDRFLPDKAIDVIDEAGAAMRLSSAHRKKVHPSDIEKIVARIAKIPTRSVSTTDKSKLEHLESRLKQVVFGQDDAIHSLVTAIKRSRAGLGAPEKPIGNFLFTGPTGVGKTEVARQLAGCLGIEFIRFDMSEYMEKHAVARLIGAPPGYIGFDQGGLLTDQIRKHPYCVLLLDEIEKAHVDLFNILLQVMDYATLTDNNGKKSDFRNVILIMTSNIGAREMTTKTIGFGDPVQGVRGREKSAIEKHFSPEFRNRLDDVINFNGLTLPIMEKVVDKFVSDLRQQLHARQIRLTISAKARTWLAEKGYVPQYGARPLARLIQTEIKDRISDEVLFGKLAKGGRVVIGLRNDQLTFSYPA
jgi:ATP-dependent Clp protease ATP-binding subunit ClpA